MLQLMINRFKKYCEEWGLVVTKFKSKIMIMKITNGKLKKEEQWWFDKERIEVETIIIIYTLKKEQ